MKFIYEDLIRFWNYVDIKTPEECWEWLRALNNKGYGKFSINKGHIGIYAHRFSYWCTYNFYPGKLNVCHSCDNPKCCNPNHLWLGTQLDNIKDCVKKKRNSPPPIPINQINRAKLTLAQVLEIKLLFKSENFTCESVAKLYNMSNEAIRQIKIGKSWKHVNL
jgi:hypothetical protein